MDTSTYISRNEYIDKVRPYIGKQIIKVFVGQRRVGKSFIMRQVADIILRDNPQANIIFVDKERLEFAAIKDEMTLNEYVESKLMPTDNYLFIDEVQEIARFELCLRSLLNQNKCDIYCSGSNAHMLSGELATHLSGRYIAIPVYSLSFKEYLHFNKLSSSREALQEYLIRGGMPYLINLPKDRDITFEYLKNIYSTILLRDVVAKESIRNISFLENLVSFLADNVGSTFSVKSISDYLKSQQINLTVPTIQNYITNLCNSYMLYKVPRVDIKGMKIFEIGEKYFFEDLGIRNALRNVNMRTDINKLMENAVYKDLLSRGYKVYVGKLWNKEVDFVADKGEERIYIQVAYLLANDDTIEREFGNLKAIDNNFPKYVVTMDEYPCGQDYPGIRQMHLLDFLMAEKL